MAFSEIEFDITEGIVTITLNRPERLNAWTPVMADEVRQAMRTATDGDAFRVILRTGAGRGFCAGADIGNLAQLSASRGPVTAASPPPPFDPSARPDFQRRDSYFPAVSKPIIAAVNGPCAGLGFVIALFCDL